jgi:preprotein translocase subunit SecF
MIFDIVGIRYIFFVVSLLIILPGLISLLLFGVKLGIDFKGGTLWEVIPKSADVGTDRVTQLLKDNGHEEAVVQNATLIAGGVTTNTLVMRMAYIGENLGEKDKLVKLLVENNIVEGRVVSATVNTSPAVTATGTVTTTPAAAATTGGSNTVEQTVLADGKELLFDSVGPTVGNELATRAILAVLLASLGILAYLSYAFRGVPNAVRYGVCAVIALLHDVLIVVGIFSILGQLFNIEIDALFITAMLTVIGFSVHDSVVVFDRIRENMIKRRFDSFEKVVNYSLLQTLARSINTSLTVLITLLALYLFGGVSIRNFVLALLIGITSGTFSSIFNASLLLVVWENKEWRNWFGRGGSSSSMDTARSA